MLHRCATLCSTVYVRVCMCMCGVSGVLCPRCYARKVAGCVERGAVEGGGVARRCSAADTSARVSSVVVVAWIVSIVSV